MLASRGMRRRSSANEVVGRHRQFAGTVLGARSPSWSLG